MKLKKTTTPPSKSERYTVMPDFYETDVQVNEYLVFHYANLEQTLPWKFGPHQALGFHTRLAECIDSSQLPEKSRALDLGCAVGRTSRA